MSHSWTPEQHDAIAARDENLLVSAGAGSGKTAVMTQRVAQLVLDGVSLKRMLIVTFTNAAAAEMKRRISQRLAAAAADQDLSQTQRERARVQLEDFDSANISTLHAFCISLLRRHFHETGLDPAFRVGDPYECAILRSEAVNDVLETLYETGDPDLFALDDGFATRHDGLDQLILSVFSFMMSLSDPYEWLSRAVRNYDLSPDDVLQSDAYRMQISCAAVDLRQATDKLQRAQDLLPSSSEYDNLRAKFSEQIACVKAALMLLEQSDASLVPPLSESFFRLDFPKKKDAVPAPKDAVKALRNAAKELITTQARLDWDAQNLSRRMRAMLPMMRALERAVAAFAERYGALKQERGILDFSDLEQNALAALHSPDVAAHYRDRFDYIFVDEYQDTSGVQEALLSRIVRGDNFFCVGDSKQSIYRFRSADPSLFMARERAYEQSGAGRVIRLNRNFRSGANVLNAINDIFSRVMALGGEQSYGPNDALICAGPDTTGEPETRRPICIHLLDKTVETNMPSAESGQEPPEFQNMQDDESLVSDAQREARHIAQLIHARLGQPLFDAHQKQFRPAQYKDFAILLRTAKGQAETMARILAQEGIPTYAELTGGYFETIEVQAFLSLLTLVDNRMNDVAWLSVMRAGFCDMDDEDILAIRLRQKHASLYSAVCTMAADAQNASSDSTLSPVTAQKCATLLDLIAQAKERSRALGLEKLIEWLLEQTDYLALVAALDGSAQRLANVEALLERARHYESLSTRGLSGYLSYIEGLRSSGEDMGEARLAGEGGNCVRITTIHKSKGLEYPIVFLALCARQFNMLDLRKKVVLHRQGGIGTAYYDAQKRSAGETLLHHHIKHRLAGELRAEELRLLYVALTRAMQEIVVVGSQKRLDKQVTAWQEQKPMNSLLDFVMNAAIAFPAAQPLCDAYGISSHCDDMPVGVWKIEWLRQPDAPSRTQPSIPNVQRITAFLAQCEDVDCSPLAQRWRWRYPDVPIPGKVGASSLSGGRLSLDLSPRFLMPERMTAADIGAATHTVLQHIDFQRPLDETGVRKQLLEMHETERLTQEQLAAVDVSLLCKFFASPLAQRMKHARQIEREWPFTLQLPASSVFDVQSDEYTTVQGVIDACFIESGAWVLVDYKTDSVKNADEMGLRAIAERHALQLSIYAQALAELTGIAVRERHVVLLRAGEAILLNDNLSFKRPAYRPGLFAMEDRDPLIELNTGTDLPADAGRTC